jgi:uncharacterized damage-inducible protein DinB
MIDIAYVRRMARYNRWQNENLYAAADGIAEEERRRERDAFFGSIHKTLSHLLWGDRMWMSRFAGTPRPEGGVPQSTSLYPEWEALKRERRAFDLTIIGWSDGLDPEWPTGDLSWFSGAIKAEVTRPKWQLVMHFFNHQTHHRGQVHCMLTQAGARPHDTDLFLMPE